MVQEIFAQSMVVVDRRPLREELSIRNQVITILPLWSTYMKGRDPLMVLVVCLCLSLID